MQNIEIRYEDNHIIVVKKQPNIPSQADKTEDMDMLTIIKDHIKQKYDKPGNVYLGLVHRLDRPVGGVMVFAKTSKAASRLSDQVREKVFKKKYLAVVDGKFNSNTGTLEDYLYKDERNNMSKVVNKEKKNAKLAKLDYEVLVYNELKNLSLVKVNLHTGRHHQIRVQFSSRNYPLYGDHKYNKNFINNNKENLALIAAHLSFYHPVSKELLHFSIDLPKKYPYNLF